MMIVPKGLTMFLATIKKERATEPINVFLGTVTSTESDVSRENLLHNFNTHPEKIYATVNVNDHHDITLKVDTGANACVITTTDLQNFPFSVDILPCGNILKGYGGSEIENIGVKSLFQEQVEQHQV
jgi:hypothetical protein